MVSSKKLNLFTGSVVWVLVMLSITLTASVMYRDTSGETIIEVLDGGTAFAIVGCVATVLLLHQLDSVRAPSADRSQRTWRMPPLDTLASQNMTLSERVWIGCCTVVW
ncbi:natural resistance-associated macrophage protein [Caballeronia catudaia]|uniref:Natural resistance-associated macrophage protein n=1 Tax=Caballeronia catudaia TaxID=1777136 RepID=A0A158DBZ1_9BURK|nr:natural resistance-associated macrophage protein [Caballeronia catudaia]